MRVIALSAFALVAASVLNVMFVRAEQLNKQAPAEGGSLTSAPITNGKATLTPENTRIQFVGTHVGPKPDPRIGVFKKFSGNAEVDVEKKFLKSVTVKIQTASLETPIGKLTNHLRSPDFFDTRAIPTAKFVSTSVTPGDQPNSVVLAGKLTLLKETKEIKFPAKVSISDKGLSLTSAFTIDRTAWGMTFMPDRVNKEVEMTISIGPQSTN